MLVHVNFTRLIGGSLLLLLCLTACSSALPLRDPTTPAMATDAGHTIQQCLQMYQDATETIEAAGVNDAQDARIPGFPYLRINRFLSGLRDQLVTDAAFRAWVNEMHALALAGLEHEVMNLPTTHSQTLLSTTSVETYLTNLQDCGKLLTEEDLLSPPRKEQLLQLAVVPDEYSGWQRAVGIYPIVVLPVAWGIANWHEETRQSYAAAAAGKPPAYRFIRYGPAASDRGLLKKDEIAKILSGSVNNPLGIPKPHEGDLRRLFRHFAPVWQVDTRDNNDHIGSLVRPDRNEAPVVESRQPMMYTSASYTRVRGQVLLQLNYVIWFPARPKEGAIDLLGGHLDGITWRVTLNRNGIPLLYDSIHNCGCYHLFFPGEKLVARKPPNTLAEIALVPQKAPDYVEGRRIQLRISAGRHYIEQVKLVPEAAWDRTLRFEDYDQLRSLPLRSGNHASAFDTNGVISSSARGERFLFWPLGVPAPGAMRIWGHHATAFIGRRHFDDINLITRYFSVR